MEIKKELVIAGLIGGITSLVLAYATKRVMWRKRCGKGKGGRKWGES